MKDDLKVEGRTRMIRGGEEDPGGKRVRSREG